MEELIKNLIKKVGELETKPGYYDIFSQVIENELGDVEEIQKFIEDLINLEEF